MRRSPGREPRTIISTSRTPTAAIGTRLITSAAGSTNPSGRRTGRGSRFVGFRRRDHTPLVIIDADGSRIVNLTERTGLRGWAPSWSPDGRWLVTAATPRAGKPNSLYIMHPDGSQLHRIT